MMLKMIIEFTTAQMILFKLSARIQSLDKKWTTIFFLLYSYFSLLHTGWLPVAEAAKDKKKLKT